MKRRKISFLIILLITIILGLSSRFIPGMPDFVDLYLGDFLYAAMIYWGFCFLMSKPPISKIALIALCTCFLIEVSQLYHAPWIDSIRANRLGGLVLGFGFLWSDLIAYTGGVLFSSLLEIWWRKNKKLNRFFYKI